MKEFNELIQLWDVKNEYEFKLITSTLEKEGIPFIVKHKGSGSYMRIISGFSIMPIIIYVSAEDFDRSQNIIELLFKRE